MIPSSSAAPLIIRKQKLKKLQRTWWQNFFRFLTVNKKARNRLNKMQSIRNYQKAFCHLNSKQIMHPGRSYYYVRVDNVIISKYTMTKNIIFK